VGSEFSTPLCVEALAPRIISKLALFERQAESLFSQGSEHVDATHGKSIFSLWLVGGCPKGVGGTVSVFLAGDHRPESRRIDNNALQYAVVWGRI
jgi:hypothetical protein